MTYEVELERTSERLRQLSEARLVAREGDVRAVLEAMTDRPVPRLQPRAWGDQVLLIGREVAEPRREAIGRMLVELRRGFDLTPGG